ncbi:phage integrase N-terminal SAM-like domain-containing protein [Methylomicrobium lacus]|uniref:phage integrase N-terminal SAM-like domain-containing protein n=1 Tax=Methylomicrobium lacus TaxID=136992 RepID=UPI0035A8DA6F
MLTLPQDLSQKFNDLLTGKSFPDEARASYLKWLRFYWDFCKKYQYDPYSSESLPWFLHKLVEKRQSEHQQKQARHSITLFYRMKYNGVASSETSQLTADSAGISVRYQFAPLTITPSGTAKTGAKPLIPANQGNAPTLDEINQTAHSAPKTGSSWVFVYNTLNSEIKIRHYSPKTLKSYRSWTRHFQTFTKSKDHPSTHATRCGRFFEPSRRG